MEKLLKLLNEYEESRWSVIDDILSKDSDEEIIEETPLWKEYEGHLRHCNANIVAFEKTTFDSYPFSKKYGFINRLVENKKIDEKKLNQMERTPRFLDKDGSLNNYELADEITMLLSISDNPIRLLMSILN